MFHIRILHSPNQQTSTVIQFTKSIHVFDVPSIVSDLVLPSSLVGPCYIVADKQHVHMFTSQSSIFSHIILFWYDTCVIFDISLTIWVYCVGSKHYISVHKLHLVDLEVVILVKSIASFI